MPSLVVMSLEVMFERETGALNLLTEGKNIVKVIAVPNKLVNIVVK